MLKQQPIEGWSREGIVYSRSHRGICQSAFVYPESQEVDVLTGAPTFDKSFLLHELKTSLNSPDIESATTESIKVEPNREFNSITVDGQEYYSRYPIYKSPS